MRSTARRRAAFLESYLTSLIERGATELSIIKRRGDLRRLLVGRPGGLLVQGALVTQSGIPRTTLSRYVELLAAVFIIKQIPAWSGNHTQRTIGTPKVAYVDSGLACTCSFRTPPGSASPTVPPDRCWRTSY